MNAKTELLRLVELYNQYLTAIQNLKEQFERCSKIKCPICGNATVVRGTYDDPRFNCTYCHFDLGWYRESPESLVNRYLVVSEAIENDKKA